MIQIYSGDFGAAISQPAGPCGRLGLVNSTNRYSAKVRRMTRRRFKKHFVRELQGAWDDAKIALPAFDPDKARFSTF